MALDLSSLLALLLPLILLDNVTAGSSVFVDGSHRELVLPKKPQVMKTIRCDTQGADDIFWDINGAFVRTLSHESFHFSDGARENVSFPQSVEVNNTNLTCKGTTGNKVTFLSTVTIIIADVPLQPVPKLTIMDNKIAQICWDPPYSAFQITSYNFSSILSSGQSHSILLDQNNLCYNVSLNYSLLLCANITVWLIASNEVGTSLPGSTSQQLPARPRGLQKPNASITYTAEGIPHIKVTFVFPELCENTDADYYLTVAENNKNIFSSEERTALWTQRGVEMNINIQSDVIRKDKQYNISVVVSTTGGTEISTTTIDTTDNRDPDQPSIGGIIPSQSFNTYIVVAAGALGILLLLFVIIVVISLLIWRRKLKSRKRVCSETVLKMMVSNPVYDNTSEAIYDEIPGDTNSYLQILPTPLDAIDEGYTSVSTTPEQVRATQPKSRRQDASAEEEYTEMKSIGTVLPRLSLISENNSSLTDHEELSRPTERSRRAENQYHFK